MCRDRSHGGRRCPEDNSQARRNRRANAKLIKEYEDSTITGVTPDVTDVDSSSSVESIIERAKTVVGEYNDIQSRIGPTPKTPIFHSTELTPDEIEAEQKLIELGNTVEELAIKYGYPSEEEFEAEDNWINNEGDELLIEISKNGNEFRIENKVQADFNDGEITFFNGKGGKTTDIDEHFDVSEANGRGPFDRETIKANLIEYRAKQEAIQAEIDSHKNNFQAMIDKRSDVYRKALEDIGVEFAGTDDLKVEALTPVEGNFLEKQAKFYPKSWIDNSNKTRKKLSVVADDKARANYDNKTSTITYSPKIDDDSIMTHELGHRLEHTNPEITEAERRFLNRRAGFVDYYAGKMKYEPYEAAIYNRNPFERGYPEAGFASNYSSKVYDFNKFNDTPEKRKKYIEKHGALKGDGYYEVLTTGMEITFFGKHGAGLGLKGMKKDPEHNRFILGLMASTAK